MMAVLPLKSHKFYLPLLSDETIITNKLGIRNNFVNYLTIMLILLINEKIPIGMELNLNNIKNPFYEKRKK